MATKQIYLFLLVSWFCVRALVAGDYSPRIALLLNDSGRHREEFDAALKTLGWSADRYPCNKESMRELASKLGDYDMLIAAPLFNYGKAPLLPGDDREAYKRFLADGGLLAVTDGSYPGVRALLADISPAFGGLETGNCNSSQWAINGVTVDAESRHPLRFFPSEINEPNSWGHFCAPPKDSPWRVVAKCSEGHPVTVVQLVGKGIVSLSVLRQPSAKQLSNFYACLQLTRAGIALKSFELPELAVGEGRLRLRFEDEELKAAGAFVYEITPESAKPQRFEGRPSAAELELPYRITTRGTVVTRLAFEQNNKSTTLFERKVILPQLLTVTPNAYRGILSTARRLPTVRFVVKLAPIEEKLDGTSLALTVLDAQGKQVAANEATLGIGGALQLEFDQLVELEQSLPAGSYTVRATLTDGKRNRLGNAETTFQLVAPRPAQTIIDEDGTLLVNGKPFFPLGLYHVPPEDFGDAAKLGVNTVQFWAWSLKADAYGVSRGLASASAHGLKTVFEMNHKSEDIFRRFAQQLADNPALLMWYGADEPGEGDYGPAAMLLDTFHKEDVHHPVYMVSCRPDVYAEQAVLADVFAIDPYGKPQKVLDCLSKAAVALQGRKPLMCVPGVFGKETDEELRANAYLALTHDARGIRWYPWKQAGGGPLGIGLKNSPVQQAIITQLCAEITELMPALTSPTRYTYVSESGRLHGLFCQFGSKRVIVLVNGTTERLADEEATFAAVSELSTANAVMKDYFKKRHEVVSVKDGRFRISLEPYGTRAYIW